jgi:pimeloyl-ACP methyl ester carboxylesterase
MPLLLIHGYSQSHLCWLRQVSGPLAQEFDLVSYDLRGHGDSDKPLQPQHYREPSRWADEVRAVIDESGLQRPIVVVWSYAGRVILDYLNVYGAQGLGGLVMVSAASRVGPDVAGPASALQATREFLGACVAHPLPQEQFEYMLAYNQLVPPQVRATLRGRAAVYGQVLRSLTLPTLTICGELDRVNLPAMSEYTAGCVPGARSLCYPDVGHMPFWEAPLRFDADVAEFVRAIA